MALAVIADLFGAPGDEDIAVIRNTAASGPLGSFATRYGLVAPD